MNKKNILIIAIALTVITVVFMLYLAKNDAVEEELPSAQGVAKYDVHPSG